MKTACRASAIIGVVIAASAAHAQSPQVFEAKGVSSLPAAFKVAGGTWTIEDGKLKGSAAKDADAMLLLGDAKWQDVAAPMIWRATMARSSAGSPPTWM
jgi:hypothetical protein